MGIEWELACLTCREYAWLGSLKPWKWHGFQIGNEAVAELFAQHTAATCDLLLDRDYMFNTWRDINGPLPGWRIDTRSCHESRNPDGPHRVSRVMPAVAQVTLSCRQCNVDHTARLEAFEALAEWMSEHVGHPLAVASIFCAGQAEPPS